MKHFITKILVFGFVLLCYFGVNSAINYRRYSNQAPEISERVLIAGDSHPQTGLNPEYFSSARNISKAGEPYVVTYWKLKRLFEISNPDTLILGFAPHNLSEFNDLKFSMRNWSTEIFKNSYAIENFDEISGEISVDYSIFYKTLFKEIALYPKRSHTKYLGAFISVKTSDVSDLESSIKRHYYLEGKELGVSDVALEYLDSLVNLCVAKDITLALVSSPVHKAYFEKIPPTIMKTYNRMKGKYGESCVVIDKTGAFYPDSLLINADHLNEYGAKRFTEEVIRLLN